MSQNRVRVETMRNGAADKRPYVVYVDEKFLTKKSNISLYD